MAFLYADTIFGTPTSAVTSADNEDRARWGCLRAAHRTTHSVRLVDVKAIVSYPQVGLGVILCMEYNVYEVGKSGKRVNNFLNKFFMLIGEYIHTIDEKNRVSMPVKFRKEMGKKIIITPGLDSCLFIFTIKEWMKVSKKLSDSGADLSFLKADQRSFNRYMFGRAAEVEIDSIGRILIPDFLKERIGLKDKAAIIGVEDRVEIWNDKVWSQNQEVVEKQAPQLAEKLGNNKSL
ncbi:MAG: division/cell wall cluster transcriptional repressor MraZ [Patescibacteria group bacterium]